MGLLSLFLGLPSLYSSLPLAALVRRPVYVVLMQQKNVVLELKNLLYVSELNLLFVDLLLLTLYRCAVLVSNKVFPLSQHIAIIKSLGTTELASHWFAVIYVRLYSKIEVNHIIIRLSRNIVEDVNDDVRQEDHIK
jgi:hypothetical protein